MQLVIQRVSRAAVVVDGETVGRIERGLFVLLCIERDDTEAMAARAAERLVRLRCFGDDRGRMNLDVSNVGGGILVVSQFTLAADIGRGRRPGFDRAAPPDRAEALYEYFVSVVRATGVPTETGRFAAMMACEIVNDGPVTFHYAPPAG